MSSSSEYVVRLPQEANKTYNLMQFTQANVDVKSWTKNSVRLEREGTSGLRDPKTSNEEPEVEPRFGAGSEFGKAEREEARAKKYTPRKRDDKHWVLRVGGKAGRRYKGMRKGQFMENAAYYIFFQAHDGAFEAVPVSESYDFTLVPKYKPLTAEEAEVAFEKRDKIRNYSLVMKSMKNESSAAADSDRKLSKKASGFRVTDQDDWLDEDSEDAAGGSDEEDGDKKFNNRNKGKNKGRNGSNNLKKKKKKDDDDYDSDPGEESDEGDFDQREMDYISDSSSAEEDDKADEDQKDLKGVEDEDALRQLVLSEDEDEEDGERPLVAGAGGNLEPGGDKDKAADPSSAVPESESSASDDSEDSDLDDEERYKAMFMQRKNTSTAAATSKSNSPSSSSRSQTPVKETLSTQEPTSENAGEKRKLDESGGPSAKKLKASGSSSDESLLSEESVRRYLMRKPMSMKDLLKKFQSKAKNSQRKAGGEGASHVLSDLAPKIATLLKKINPDQQMIKGELYLSLKAK